MAGGIHIIAITLRSQLGLTALELVARELPNMTVGVEDSVGVAGSSRYFNGTGTPPAPGVDLQVHLSIGGTATLGFDAEITCATSPIVNRANLDSGGTSETAIAVTKVAGAPGDDDDDDDDDDDGGSCEAPNDDDDDDDD